MNLVELKTRYDCMNHVEKQIFIPEKPKEGLILLTGTSGSGKSTILRSWFPAWNPPNFDNNVSVVENFDTIDTGVSLLNALGLRTVPAWLRARDTLSNGEGHRADCALALHRGAQCIDEFTSYVDRDTAKALSCSTRKYHKEGLLVVATCHTDIEAWLQPDLVYDCDLMVFRQRRLLQRPSLRITVFPSEVQDWVYFAKYHYLTGDIAKSCHCYTAYLGQKRVAFYAVIHACNRDIPTFWRGSRLVVLPEFQGLGIGNKLANAVASEYVKRGHRFFEKTANIPIGEHRNKSPYWRATSTNMKARSSYLKNGVPRVTSGFGKTASTILRDAARICYSHECVSPIPPEHW